MKQLKLLFTVLFLAVLGLGNVWAEEKTITFSDVASANSWSNGVAYTDVTLEGFRFEVSGEGNNGKYYTSDVTWRFYTGGGLTITPTNGATITSVTSNPESSFTVTTDGSSASISFTATVKYKSITIAYTAGDGDDDSDESKVTWIASEQGYTNGVQYTSATADANISFAFGDGSNDGKYYDTGTGIRLYANGKLTVNASNSATIKKIIVYYSASGYAGTFSANSGDYSLSDATGTWIGSASSVVLTNTASSGHARIQKIAVTYTASAGSEQPTLNSIAVSGTPDKTAYKVGDAFDPAGLVVTGTYSEGDPKAITEGITWNVTPETLTEGLTSVSVTATVSGKTSAAYVVNGLTVTAPDPAVSFIFNTDDGLSALGIAKPNASAGTELGSSAYASGVITMTATDGSTKTRVWNSAGTTDLRIYSNGGKLTFTGATITKIKLEGSTVNGFTANVGTYATDTWSGSATSVTLTATGTEKINTITISYVAGSAAETVATPILPAEGAFVGSKSVELSCETDGASIYYTLDGTDPTSASTLYNGAFTLTETATVKAIAVKDGMLNSAVASATYTKVVTLNSMDEIFAAATTAGSTAASKVITFDNWVISGVKNNNAYLTDNNGKGLIIYQNGHGFEVGDILSGTATCNVQLYNGSAELTALTSTTEGLTVNKEGIVTPIENASIASLGGVNTGAIYSFSELTYDGSVFSDGENTIKPYNTFITLPTLLTGKSYNVTGMYLQFNAVKEILPRTEADIEAAASDVTLTSIVISGTATKTSYFVGNAFDPAGLIATATYSDASTQNVTSSAEWSFDPATLALGTTTVNVTATFNEVASAAYPVSVTVSTLPVWATTYTSNVTLSTTGGTSATASKVKVNGEETEYDAIKAGTGSNDGKIKVTLPLGTTKLHFHAVTWSGSAATATLSVKKDGDATELFGNVIRPNTGLSSNSPYTLAGDPTDDYYSIDFGSALTEATTFVFDASVDRFAIYGVNVEKVEVELLSIAVSGTPTTTEYYDGQAFDPAGLVVTGTYNIGEPQKITEGIDWTFDPATLATGATSVTVTATVGDKVSAPFVVNGLTVTELPSLGDAVIIVFPYDNKCYAMKSDLTVAEVRMINGKVFGIAEADRTDYTWFKNEAEEKATFRTVGGNYLAGSTGTALATQAAEYKWDIVDGHYEVTIGTSHRSFLIQNNSGTLAVKNYAITNIGSSNYSDYAIFAAEFMDGEEKILRENLIHGAIGTYCADKNVDYYEGATFYVPEYKTMAGEHAASVYFVEAKTLEAGHAYIYVAEAEEITAIVSGDAESTAVTGEPMVGTLKDTLFSVEADYTVYIVYENELRPVVKDAKVSLAAGRAYLNMNVLSSNAPATPAPGRKRISMGVTGANTATGLDNVEGNANVQKVLVNGNIYILRGEKMFNINGQLVK